MSLSVAIRTMLAGAGAHVKSCAAGMQSEGTDVRWVGSFFPPASSQTHCYVEGPSLKSVADLDARAGLPYDRIVEVAEVTPASV